MSAADVVRRYFAIVADLSSSQDDLEAVLHPDIRVVEVDRPIRLQGIYKRDVRVGNNVWVGYGAAFLRGVTVGDNAVVGTYSVVGKDVPANAVVAGVPAKLLRMRAEPETLRWS